MKRMLERAAIAGLAAAAAFAVATTTGQGGNQRGGFIDIPRGGRRASSAPRPSASTRRGKSRVARWPATSTTASGAASAIWCR
jgi:hypothetical protein